MNKAIKTEKKFEFFLGLFFLIPPILGVFFFLLSLCDTDGSFVNMTDLSGQWDWHDGSGDLEFWGKWSNFALELW